MILERELEFLRATFKKIRLKTRVSALSETSPSTSVGRLEQILAGELPSELLPKNPSRRTLYKAGDSFGLRYMYMLVSEEELLTIGPYLTAPISERVLAEIYKRNEISPKQQQYFAELCESIPVLEDGCQAFTMLYTFLEELWHSPSFAIVDVAAAGSSPSPLGGALNDDSINDIIVNMRAMEQRYAFENELMEAVTLGQLHKETLLFSAVSSAAFEKRIDDPVRNAKNYAVIMNTLLRKAAEQGGVHPVYIDRASTDFAMKIECMESIESGSALMCEMFRGYCRLVRKHSMRTFSPLIQKTVLIIDSDLASDLSLSALATAQGVSSGYLSSLFKKETGRTLSEYVRERRIKYAAHLLSTTNLQIQTVALHCGILDLQYFSKLFKKEIGKSPKEYRDAEKSRDTGREAAF